MPTLDNSARSIGQAELAKLAKVSQKTVSRALADGAGVNEHTRQRIQALAAQHQYRPNAAARSTRQGRFGSIALLLGTHGGQSTLPQGLLNGIHDALRKRGINLMVVKLNDEELTDTDRVPAILGEANSDGLLIDYTHGFPSRMEQLIDDYGIPAVWLNAKKTSNAVYPNDREASRRATEHLIKLGHRRIGYVDYNHGRDHPSRHYSVTDRKEGYVESMQAAGLLPRPFEYPGFNIPRDRRIEVAGQMLGEKSRPTAILCYGETTTVPIYVAATKAGLAVPDDLSLVQFGDEPPRTLGPAIDTFITALGPVGEQAVELLHQRIKRLRDLPAVAVSFHYEPGQTCVSVTR